MSTNRFARPRAPARRKAEPQPDLDFDPVVMRERADGWLPERQVEFIEALAETGCVEAACGRVGMSTAAAYKLRARPDAIKFRRAWEAAVRFAIRRLSDAAHSRALHGVARPVFYKGEQIGERRYYDERLTQFLLRYNDPVRYGRWRDGMMHEQVEAGPAFDLVRSLQMLDEEAWGRVTPKPALTAEERRRALMTREERAAEQAAADQARWDALDAAEESGTPPPAPYAHTRPLNPPEGDQLGAT